MSVSQNLTMACHPERSAGGKAGGAESKDRANLRETAPACSGILRLRSAPPTTPPSPPRCSAQNDTRFLDFGTRSKTRRAFTLLEVIIATMIIGMMVVTIYRFLAANLTAMRVSNEITDEREAVQAVVRLIEGQLNDLPLVKPGVLSGKPLKFRNLSNDELTWRCTAGAGLLTSAAPGEYDVTLTVQPVSERSSDTELGLRRKLLDPTEAIDATQPVRGSGTDKYNWVPLIRPMAALEVRYFSAQLNAWQDTWADTGRRPDLVRVRLCTHAGDLPVGAVLAVPSARIQR